MTEVYRISKYEALKLVMMIIQVAGSQTMLL